MSPVSHSKTKHHTFVTRPESFNASSIPFCSHLTNEPFNTADSISNAWCSSLNRPDNVNWKAF